MSSPSNGAIPSGLCAKPQKPKIWTDAEKRTLIALAKKGAGVSKISAELGRYTKSVKLMAREMGLLLKK